MRIIARRSLLEYIAFLQGHKDQKALKRNPDCWFAEVSRAAWKCSEDVKAMYTWASVISSDRVVFDLLTNRYRLVTAIDYEKGIVWIKWIGTHAEYDRINVREVQYVRH